MNIQKKRISRYNFVYLLINFHFQKSNNINISTFFSTLFLLRKIFSIVNDYDFQFIIFIIIFLSIIRVFFKKNFISIKYIKTFCIFFNNLSICLKINELIKILNDNEKLISIAYLNYIYN